MHSEINTLSTSRRSLPLPHRDIRKFLRRLKWLTHPVTVFIFLQMVWLAITLIWVIWFVGERETMSELAARFGSQAFDSRISVAILVVGCILLGVLLVGTILLFVFGQRQSYMARQQKSFVSSVTHELKSPLASLQLTFETMNTHRLDAKTSARMREMISSDIDRLRRLVDQILVAGRLDSGAMQFDDEHQSVHLRELLDKIIERHSYMDNALAQRVSVHISGNENPKVSRSALTLILSNLIENAVKYSPRESPVTVVAEASPTELFIMVQDQGIGLDKAEKSRIFRMFHRGDMATRKAIPGTGLGLYIARTALRNLGGKIWADSAGRGQGSSFYVTLPLKQAAEA